MDSAVDWNQLNQQYLTTELARIRGYIERLAVNQEMTDENDESQLDISKLEQEQQFDEVENIFPLDRLVSIFSLSEFERDVLLLCAGIELDSKFRDACVKVLGNGHSTQPTFSLALAVLPDAHWSALSPHSPLRYWRLIEITGDSPTNGSLRIDERILHYLVGVDFCDPRLNGLVRRRFANAHLFESQQALSEQLIEIWSDDGESSSSSVVQLIGSDAATRSDVVANASVSLGYQLYALHEKDIPTQPAECEAMARLWQREAALSGYALLIELDDPLQPQVANRLEQLLDTISGFVILSGNGSPSLSGQHIIPLIVPEPSYNEQLTHWRACLGEISNELEDHVLQIVDQFSLVPQQIQWVCDQLLSANQIDSDLTAELWDLCKKQTHQPLHSLVQQIEPTANWNDIVLPEQQIELLKQIAMHVRHRATVYETWGFAAKSKRGLGISTLFSGLSGTGKTMAAEVLANELDLDLYRIDLSQVVSKYIAETEKNLDRIFNNKRIQSAVLLFDEADALFGKRSEVRDSHDRYANIEISYLLQKMEQYHGLVILTTNMKQAIDTAFIRRIRFIIQFPFPDATSRAEIWRRIFPKETPIDELDPEKLAQLNISGGSIRNIAMNAAFMAAAENKLVNKSLLLNATHIEYAKIEKSLSESERQALI